MATSNTAALPHIELKSDVCRDLIHNAEGFKHPKNVIWEYVANGLQYQDNSVNPRVDVNITTSKIEIIDNGMGMDRAGLQHFFTMHAENLERKQGRIGRGMFGTGKSAAFAIANSLQIDTVRNGLRNVVELKKDDVKAYIGKDKGVPVSEIVTNEKTKEPNRTIVTITEFFKDFKKIKEKPIVGYIEQNLIGWPANCSVYVNGSKCEYQEPAAAFERDFTPDPEVAKLLGNVTLCIKVSGIPLESNQQGVKIISSNQVHEITLAGSEGKDCAEYIFGTIEVPNLDKEEDPPAFDSSRSGQLNASNQLVRMLYGFISGAVEEIRKELVRRKKEERKSEEAKKFRRIEGEVSEVINKHFNQFRSELIKSKKALSSGGADVVPNDPDSTEGDDDSFLVPGTIIPASETGEPLLPDRVGDEKPEPTPETDAPPPELKQGLEKNEDEPTTTANPGGGQQKNRPRGGFHVKAEHLGKDEWRTRYVQSERTIKVNLDHPQIAAAYKEDVDDPVFKRLFYEVAFFEYVNALMFERVLSNEYFPDFTDFLQEIGRQMNEIATQSAFLYAA